MRMLVMGGGLQGSACAWDLLQNDAVERVVLADNSDSAGAPFLDAWNGDPRLQRVVVDARDDDAVRALMQDADACMNALPYYFNLPISRLAIEAQIHYCDLGGNTAIVFEQIELDEQARSAGISVIPDCGLAPGMVNILARAGIDAVDEPDTVRIFVGGLPQDPQPPLNYQIVYSLHGVLDYYTTRSWVLRNGEPQEIDALSEIEPVEFPPPVGMLEAFHTAGGLSTMPWTYRGVLRSMEYKTLRYPGHAETMRTIRALGLLSTEPVLAGGVDVVPRDVFIACVEPLLRRPESRDLVALRVEAEGRTAGEHRRIIYELLDFRDDATGITAMERTTGFSLSITGQMQVLGHVNGPGVRTPDEAVPAAAYIHELGRRGVDVRRVA